MSSSIKRIGCKMMVLLLLVAGLGASWLGVQTPAWAGPYASTRLAAAPEGAPDLNVGSLPHSLSAYSFFRQTMTICENLVSLDKYNYSENA
ncbi:hypothetical protein [Paenibacillus glacialis]|uniref:Uncharacterized protein n=1 Tax=Paenibacillus glacialis TaxID=494026 RepID=A0A162M5Z6_9BACL|nr:hypothetical protein [Paenibacillus glacialis]OAB38933.1 hypothetical protein PGLA_19380 [Paenibacillus glacialis]